MVAGGEGEGDGLVGGGIADALVDDPAAGDAAPGAHIVGEGGQAGQRLIEAGGNEGAGAVLGGDEAAGGQFSDGLADSGAGEAKALN
jgi:hypothetical protein